MAVTGVGLLLFLIGHMVGNLQIFLGPEAINRYAHFLHSNHEILWPARIGLLVFVTIHMWTSITLTLENRAARNHQYEVKELVDASLASRTMMITGSIIAGYVVYHLLHLTARMPVVNLTGKDFGELEVYDMMVTGFSNPAVSVFYIIAVGLICFHLSHGAASWFQTLGLRSAAYEATIEKLATILAWGLFVGYSIIPLAILLRLVK